MINQPEKWFSEQCFSVHQINQKMSEPYSDNRNDPRMVGVISYLTLLGWIIAYLLNKPRSETISFHMRQSLGTNLLFLASSLCLMIPIIGWFVSIAGYLAGAIMWVFGLIYAIQEEEKVVPILGDRFQEWFQGV